MDFQENLQLFFLYFFLWTSTAQVVLYYMWKLALILSKIMHYIGEGSLFLDKYDIAWGMWGQVQCGGRTLYLYTVLDPRRQPDLTLEIDHVGLLRKRKRPFKSCILYMSKF